MFVLICFLVSNFSVTAQDKASSLRQHALFPDSRVTSITPWTISEQSSSVPENILPAFIGSGTIGIGIDASGMQNLDCRVSKLKAYGKPDDYNVDDLYVFHEQMISDHISKKNLMPLGFFELQLEIDGNNVDIRSASDWHRDVNIKQAWVKTTANYRQQVEISVLAFMPHNTPVVYYQFAVCGIDQKKHLVKLTSRLNLVLRKRNGGKCIYDKVEILDPQGKKAAVKASICSESIFKPLQDYAVLHAVSSSGNGANRAGEQSLCSQHVFETDAKPQFAQSSFYLGSSQLNLHNCQALQAMPLNLEQKEFDAVFNAHIKDYNEFYAGVARIQIGNPKRELLFNNSIYLFRSGCSFKKGIPICLLLFHPTPWHGATFWDTGFIIDGLIRTNNVEPAADIVKFLHTAAKPKGRTFPWIIWYNGASAMPPDWNDTGFLVNPAHAMAAVRLYEATQNKDLLVKYCYPLLKSVSEYLVSQRIKKEGDHYIGSSVAGDINTELQENETFTTAWYSSVLRKAHDYALLLAVDSEQRSIWKNVSGSLLLEKGINGYNESRTKSRPGNWVSMLLYPTEAKPFVDVNHFRKNRSLQCFIDEYSSRQPWVYFWQAVSDMRIGDNRSAEVNKLIDEGLRYVYGPAYFSEIAPLHDKALTGMPPCATAHGTYLTASAELLCRGGIWDNNLEVFVDLPRDMQPGVSFERIRTPRGVVVSGRYSPDQVRAEFHGDGQYMVKIGIPGTFLPKPGILINKTPSECKIESNSIQVPLNLLPGTAAVVEIRKS